MNKTIILIFSFLVLGIGNNIYCNDEVIQHISNISPNASQTSYKKLVEKITGLGYSLETAIQLWANRDVEKTQDNLEKNLGIKNLFKDIHTIHQELFRPLATKEDKKMLISEFDKEFTDQIMNHFNELDIGLPHTLILRNTSDGLPNGSASTLPFNSNSPLRGHIMSLSLSKDMQHLALALILHELGHLVHFDTCYRSPLFSFIERCQKPTDILDEYLKATEKRADLFGFWALHNKPDLREKALESQIPLWKTYKKLNVQPLACYPLFSTREALAKKLLNMHKALRL